MVLAVAACAADASRRMPEAQYALAHPEPDPACRDLVGGMLAVRGIDQVTAAVAVDPAGGAEVVRFLAPDLTPAQADDLRRAMAGCSWSLGPRDGGAASGDVTFERKEPRQAR